MGEQLDKFIQGLKEEGVLFFALNVIMTFFILGLVCNGLVVNNNGQRMPVKMDYEYSSDRHFSYNDSSQVNYPFLSDIISTPYGIYSIGDFLMLFVLIALILTIIIYSIWKYKKYKKSQIIVCKNRS